ncbi:MAG TPA: YqgE/AlgH family protein [Usitatibacter sp.]|nr:YqgE/AlgH family protein [Usitatibacter sp.]
MFFRRLCAALLVALPLVCAGQGIDPNVPIFLVSRPGMTDPNFQDTVVLLTRHGPEGALGVIVNRPTDIPLSKVFSDEKRLAGLEDRIFFGGPVARDVVVYVFRAPLPRGDVKKLFEGVYISSSLDLLHDLLGRDHPTEDLRVFAGLAGWAPGQLEAEIQRGDWRLVPADAHSILDAPPRSLWQEMDRRASAITARAGTTPVLR